MAILYSNNFNFTASGTVNAHDALTFDTTNSDAQKLCAKQAGSSDPIIGFAAGAAVAGDPIQLKRYEVGQIFVAIAGGAISKGAQLGISSGKVVTGGALPLFAIDAATASGDEIRIICAATLDKDTIYTPPST